MGSNWKLPYPTSTVDKIEQLGDAELSFEKIRKKHGTFRTYSNGTDRLGKRNIEVVSAFKLTAVILK